MSTRIATGGRLLNKSNAVSFSFNGKQLRGFEGDTLASALLANDQMLVGRSFKYHRPRGVYSMAGHDANSLRPTQSEVAHANVGTVRGWDQIRSIAAYR